MSHNKTNAMRRAMEVNRETSKLAQLFKAKQNPMFSRIKEIK